MWLSHQQPCKRGWFLLIYFFREKEGGKRERKRERERNIGCSLYVPWLGMEPQTLACQDDALTNWDTQPGPRVIVLLHSSKFVLLHFSRFPYPNVFILKNVEASFQSVTSRILPSIFTWSTLIATDIIEISVHTGRGVHPQNRLSPKGRILLKKQKAEEMRRRGSWKKLCFRVCFKVLPGRSPPRSWGEALYLHSMHPIH